MRVVAGSLRGRPIVAPAGETTRPTTDRTREAVFNALGSMGVLEGANVADLFAGSGALGIEAISRGAAHCRFVERDRAALESIRTNIAKLGISAKASVLAGDVMSSVSALRDIDLVLADPPYGFADWERLLRGLAPVLVEGGLVVAESAREIPLPEGWEEIRSRRYGRTTITFLTRVHERAGTV